MNNIRNIVVFIVILLLTASINLASAFENENKAGKTVKFVGYRVYEEQLGLSFSNNALITKSFENPITFLRLTGDYRGEGNFKVSVGDGIYSYQAVSSATSKSTEYDYDKIFDEYIQQLEQIYNKDPSDYINVYLDYKPLREGDIDGDTLDSESSIIGLTSRDTHVTFQHDKSGLCTAWMVFDVDSTKMQTVCNGANSCCQLYGIDSTRGQYNETFYIHPGKMGANSKTIVGASVSYVEMSRESSALGVEKGEWKFLPILFYVPQKTFDDSCEKTCEINSRPRDITLKVNVNEGLLNLNSMKYGIPWHKTIRLPQKADSEKFVIRVSVLDSAKNPAGGYLLQENPASIDLAFYPRENREIKNPQDIILGNSGYFGAVLENVTYLPGDVEAIFEDAPGESVSTKAIYLPEGLEFEKATILLPKNRSVASIAKCVEYYQGKCGYWISTKTRFQDMGDYIKFDVDEPGHYAGTLLPLAESWTTTTSTTTSTSTTSTTTSTTPTTTLKPPETTTTTLAEVFTTTTLEPTTTTHSSTTTTIPIMSRDSTTSSTSSTTTSIASTTTTHPETTASTAPSSTSTSTSTTSSTSTTLDSTTTSTTTTSSTMGDSTTTSTTVSSSSSTSSTTTPTTTSLPTTTTAPPSPSLEFGKPVPGMGDYTVMDKMCLFDIDCGQDMPQGAYCDGKFVKEAYIDYKCLKYLGDEGKCVKRTRETIREWCQEGFECSPGLKKCIPDIGEEAEEEEKECSGNYGLCHNDYAREEKCVEDTDCGFTTQSKPFCGESGNAVFKEIMHVCVNAGTEHARCETETKTHRIDYCGPTQTCLEGRCIGGENPEEKCEYMNCLGEPSTTTRSPDAPKINYLDYAGK